MIDLVTRMPNEACFAAGPDHRLMKPAGVEIV
jgi:hypothetical protein